MNSVSQQMINKKYPSYTPARTHCTWNCGKGNEGDKCQDCDLTIPVIDLP